MTHKELKKLDSILGEAMGWTPFQHVDPCFWREANTYVGDQPRFKWAWGPDLIFPCVNDLHQVEFDPQFDEPRWAIAVWVAPPPMHLWKSAHGSAPYPKNGYYTPVYRLALAEGQKPDIDNTRFAAAWLKHDSAMSARERVYEMERADERRREKTIQRDMDILDDAMPAFGAIPGARGGGVSFPSV